MKAERGRRARPQTQATMEHCLRALCLRASSRESDEVAFALGNGADTGPSRSDTCGRAYRHLRGPRTLPAMSGLRRLQPVGMRKYRAFAKDDVNASTRPLAGLKIGSVNGRGARESGLGLKASIAP
jgi:hypothetical protein